MADSLPRHARRLPPTESSAQEIFRRLERFHGIDPGLASDRLHAIKEKSGRGASDNVIFDLTGNVYNPDTLKWLGSLTEGGGKR
jgi:hypothetical protein